MAKRSAFNLQYGDRKKAKLDISISDHNLPSSQSIIINNTENNGNMWGDEADDEILLQASQACDEGKISDISMLPEYSNWEQPGSTSTQYQTSPSTSKAPFEFKKPSQKLPSSISTHLKNKCSTISSPLPGISMLSHNRHSKLVDDVAISDKILSGQESDIYKRMLLLEEENKKLKAEHSELYDKIVSKEGEASILRSQLRACQAANDNARMEKIRAQEKAQMECNEKVAAISKEVQRLKTEKELKELEIMKVKEANKLISKQINDISSHRNNNGHLFACDTTQQKKAKMVSSTVQTEDKAAFLKLNKSCGQGRSNALPGTLEVMMETPYKEVQLYQSVIRELRKLESELESHWQAVAFPREAEERETADLLNVPLPYLFQYQELYKCERGIEARRLLARLTEALEAPDAAKHLFDAELDDGSRAAPAILDTALRICHLIQKNPYGSLYSGYLMSLTLTLETLLFAGDAPSPKILDTVKAILTSKPMPFVTFELLKFARIASMNNLMVGLCPSHVQNRGMDVDQELNNTDACYFASLLRQWSAALGGVRRRGCAHSALAALRDLLRLLEYQGDNAKNHSRSKSCECQQLLLQMLGQSLSVAVDVWEESQANNKKSTALLDACLCCVRQLCRHLAAHPDTTPHLPPRLPRALHTLHRARPALDELTELMHLFTTAPEETPPSFLQQHFMASFETFSMTD